MYWTASSVSISNVIFEGVYNVCVRCVYVYECTCVSVCICGFICLYMCLCVCVCTCDMVRNTPTEESVGV